MRDSATEITEATEQMKELLSGLCDLRGKLSDSFSVVGFRTCERASILAVCSRFDTCIPILSILNPRAL